MHPRPLIKEAAKEATSLSERPAARAAESHWLWPAGRRRPSDPARSPLAERSLPRGKTGLGRAPGPEGKPSTAPQRRSLPLPARPGPPGAACRHCPLLPSAMTRLMRSFMSPISTVCPTKSFWSRLAAPREPGPARKSRADWKSDMAPAGTAGRSGEAERGAAAGAVGGWGRVCRGRGRGGAAPPSYRARRRGWAGCPFGHCSLRSGCFRDRCVIYDLTFLPPPARPPARRPRQPGRWTDVPAPGRRTCPWRRRSGAEGEISSCRPASVVRHRPAGSGGSPEDVGWGRSAGTQRSASVYRGGAQRASRRGSWRPGDGGPGAPSCLPSKVLCGGEPPRHEGGAAGRRSAAREQPWAPGPCGGIRARAGRRVCFLRLTQQLGSHWQVSFVVSRTQSCVAAPWVGCALSPQSTAVILFTVRCPQDPPPPSVFPCNPDRPTRPFLQPRCLHERRWWSHSTVGTWILVVAIIHGERHPLCFVRLSSTCICTVKWLTGKAYLLHKAVWPGTADH